MITLHLAFTGCFVRTDWLREQSSVFGRRKSAGRRRWYRTSPRTLVALEIGQKLRLYNQTEKGVNAEKIKRSVVMMQIELGPCYASFGDY